MNHVPSNILSADARPMTRRALAKLKTRQALMAAGKQLFTERGYEAATVRDIARAAGLSTGAVFANFADKADLFSDILAADHDILASAMRQAATQPGTVAQSLLATLIAGYRFHLEQLPLFQAARAVSWSHDATAEARARASARQITAIVNDILRRGVDRRELRAGADIELVADMIWQSYIANFRLAVFDGYDLDRLGRRLERQLGLILKAAQV